MGTIQHEVIPDSLALPLVVALIRELKESGELSEEQIARMKRSVVDTAKPYGEVSARQLLDKLLG